MQAGFTFFLGLGCSGSPALPPPTPSPHDVTVSDLRRHVAYLAADERKGRGTNTAGLEEAAEYIAASFAEIGLEPLPGRFNFFAPFSLYRTGFASSSTLSFERAEDDQVPQPTFGEDWRPFSFSDVGTVTGPVVFAGYGISAPEYGWNDYENLNVEGKIVLVLRHEPSGR